MRNRFTKRYLGFLLGGILILLLSNAAWAVTQTQIVTGLQAGVGIALDETKNQLYYVEFNGGTLKSTEPLGQCSILCISTVIASGFYHPESVQLDSARGFAYVVTRDDPGYTGVLWKVNVNSGAKTRVAINLGEPQQLALDLPSSQAYVVGYADGNLYRINLGTNAKTVVCSGLGHPVGLVITKDRKYAYVSEQDTGSVAKIDLNTGAMLEKWVASGLTAPFFLAWTDASQNSLYVVERDPANKVSRIDLATSTKNDAITGLPWRPSAIATASSGMLAYITTDTDIIKAELTELSGPVFMGVGHVPSSKIDANGYATTDPGYFFQVQHAPFGGTLNMFGNLTNFRSLGATHYKVLVSKNGGAAYPLNLSWNTYKWNNTSKTYVLTSVAPASGTTKYKIPLEADGTYHAELWYPPYLFMQWPSVENGLYTFSVEIYAGAVKLSGLPAELNKLTVKIDNTPPEVNLVSIWQKGSPDIEIQPCDIVSEGLNKYYFKITAYDPSHHLLGYGLTALWGNNYSAPIASDSYSSHVNAEGPYFWSGVTDTQVPATEWIATCNCAHTFYLWANKRTINGYNYILYGDYHKSITINNVGSTCD
ncbi:MAG: YncE family protein [Candidatus Schekmanbacteria bacterium]|nr:YncE family protein [Candidatus Schekmanbacteria bacterium]